MDDGRIVGRLAFLQPLWRWLRQPWLLLIVGGLIILLLLFARTVPQLPSLLANDSAATARWLRTASQQYGASSTLVQTLGLFDVLHSNLLRLLMLLMGLLLATQLAEQIGLLLQLRALPALLDRPVSQIGAPLLSSTTMDLYRQRYMEQMSPNAAATSYIQQMQPRLGAPMRRHRMLPFPQDEPVPSANDASAGDSGAAEIRLLWMRYLPYAYLRLLLIGSMMLALLGVWSIAQQSWQIEPFLLAPGDAMRYGALQLGLAYELVDGKTVNEAAAGAATPTSPVTIDVQLDGLVRSLQVGADGAALSMGQVTISGELGPPGLQVRTADGERLLARPNQAGVADNIGLVFPKEGDEEFILIPQAAAGLRILRAAHPQSPYFLIEVYNQTAINEGNAQPVQRFEVTEQQTFELPLSDGTLMLTIVPHPSVLLQARSLPGLWLLWPILAVILVGSASLLRRPAFLLIQIAPWPYEVAESASVVVWQGSEKMTR